MRFTDTAQQEKQTTLSRVYNQLSSRLHYGVAMRLRDARQMTLCSPRQKVITSLLPLHYIIIQKFFIRRYIDSDTG